MTTPKLDQPLGYLIKTFNTFMHQAVHYLNFNTLPSSPLSNSLYDMLMLWIHPQGVVNLVKTITTQLSNDTFLPQVIRAESLVPHNRWSTCSKIQEVIEPECTPEKPQKKIERLMSSKMKQSSASLDQNEGDKEEEESVHIKKQEGFQSSYSQSQNKSCYKRGPYKSYSLTEKLRAVNLFVEQGLSIAVISKRFGIPCKNIKRWATEGVARKRGGGRKRTNPGLEQQIYRWLFESHARGENITINQIQEYALSRTQDTQFKASRGWAIKFIERHHLKQHFIII